MKTKQILLFILFSLVFLLSFAQKTFSKALKDQLPEGFDLNSFSLSSDGTVGFLTANKEWEKQLPFLITIGLDTLVDRIHELDTMYNGAISPSGNQIIYCIRTKDQAEIFLTKFDGKNWSNAIDLSQKSGIGGGYFHWFSETEIYFQINDNNGDLAKVELVNNELVNLKKINKLNTSSTEFSPFVLPNKSHLVFTKYNESDTSQQGLMISENIGTESEPIWDYPTKLEKLEYGWGAFIYKGNLYYSNGSELIKVKNMFIGTKK